MVEQRPMDFPRIVRLCTARDYEFVFDSAQRSRDAGFTVLARRGTHGFARLGLAISKRQVRDAVGRNRIKRAVRENFRRCRAELSDLDIVVMAKGGVEHWPTKAMNESLTRHWNKVMEKCLT
jgi:ribonuclease P protein component